VRVMRASCAKHVHIVSLVVHIVHLVVRVVVSLEGRVCRVYTAQRL